MSAILLTGKRFRLKRETISIHTIGGERHIIMVPEGAILEVLSGPTASDQRMVDVQCEAKVLVMFAEDIERRGEEVSTKGAAV